MRFYYLMGKFATLQQLLQINSVNIVFTRIFKIEMSEIDLEYFSSDFLHTTE